MADGSQAFRVDIVAAWPEKNRTTFTIPLYAAPTATAPLDPDTEFDKWCTSKRLDIEKMRNSSHGAMWAIVAFKDALALQRAAPQPAREPLTDAAIDAGIEAWFTTNITTNDGKDRGHPFRERMRAAIEAAHNITATPAAQGGTT